MEDIVSFELAKKLKEKGFNKRVRGYYWETGGLSICNTPMNSNALENEFSAPTISQVLKWLREEKVVDLVIYPIFIYEADSRTREYGCKIYSTQLNKPIPSDGYYNCYEEAVLAGIKYVLDNLI